MNSYYNSYYNYNSSGLFHRCYVAQRLNVVQHKLPDLWRQVMPHQLQMTAFGRPRYNKRPKN